MDIHTPPGYGETPKPHIHKWAGQWWAAFPAQWPAPDDATRAPFIAFLRTLNGVTPWRATSFPVEFAGRVQ